MAKRSTLSCQTWLKQRQFPAPSAAALAREGNVEGRIQVLTAAVLRRVEQGPIRLQYTC